MRTINYELQTEFRCFLIQNEKSSATIKKYMHDLDCFRSFLMNNYDNWQEVDKERVLMYKEYLGKYYKNSSANSMLAALNSFFKVNRWLECVVKPYKVQREAFRSNDRDLSIREYKRLLKAAEETGDERLELAMETICSTGIRVSELQYITVESARRGISEISNKGKNRKVLMIPRLCDKLLDYSKRYGIKSGSIFVTKNGLPIDRSTLLHDMKDLSEQANVNRDKIFPHNLRHLFAVTYYSKEKNIAHLADILGHSNINTTRIYTACTSQDQIKIIQKMNLVR